MEERDEATDAREERPRCCHRTVGRPGHVFFVYVCMWCVCGVFVSVCLLVAREVDSLLALISEEDKQKFLAHMEVA